MHICKASETHHGLLLYHIELGIVLCRNHDEIRYGAVDSNKSVLSYTYFGFCDLHGIYTKWEEDLVDD